VDELTRDRSAMSMEAANREVYWLLKEGIKVSVAEREIRHLTPVEAATVAEVDKRRCASA
jgi:hypothetical protein